MKRNKIYGILMRPVSMNAKDNEKVMQSTDVSVKEGFYKAYSHHVGALQIVAECAKVYVNKNWKKVKDWSDLNVILEDANTLKGSLNDFNGGKPLKDFVEYFNYKEGNRRSMQVVGGKTRSSVVDKIMDRIDKEDRAKHNPIKTVKGVVLDPTDGDFSLTINGRKHMWISDNTIIIIADYVEKQLAKKKKVVKTKTE